MNVVNLRWGDHVLTPLGEAVYCGPWDMSHGFIHLNPPSPGRRLHNLVEGRGLSIPPEASHLSHENRSWFYQTLHIQHFTLLTSHEPCYTLL